MAPILIRVGGTPRPQQRPRRLKGRWVSSPDKKLQLWRSAVERACCAAIKDHGSPPLFTGAVRVNMGFQFAPPASDPHRSGPHTQRPDKDNLEKAVLDVMEASGMFANDCQVSVGEVAKTWGAQPGLIALISEAEESAPLPIIDTAPEWLT